MQDYSFETDIDAILAEFTEPNTFLTESETYPDRTQQNSPERATERKTENLSRLPAEFQHSIPDATTVYPAEPADRITHYAEKYRKPKEQYEKGKEKNRKEKNRKDINTKEKKSSSFSLPRRAPKEKPIAEKEKKPLLDKVSPSAVIAFGSVLTVLFFVFSLFLIRPAAGSSSVRAVPAGKTDLTASVDTLVKEASALLNEKNAKAKTKENIEKKELSEAAAMESVVPQKISYTIPETELVAPQPDPACFGSVMPDSVSELEPVIERAESFGLLDGQTLLFRTDLNFRTDTAIRYYLDETILIICWKEIIDGNTCSCAEVKLADASQIRRKFADDAFGASNTYYATDLAKSVNAVAAINADYYLFRDFGIVVYNRELYRFNESVYSGDYKKYNCVDTCFVTDSGDFLYFRKGQTTTEEELRRYIAENGVLFSIAFGPVLVENSQPLVTDWYPVGEIDKGYSRAGIGQVDRLHYLYMGLNHSNEKQARWDINTFATHFAEKGVQTAYTLDGGQTGELVFNGQPYNYIDFGAERLVSDIVYFATALPSGEVIS